MYQAVLTRRYLTSKIMPLLAMAAVTLSVGTVLVTWSVMGGFLETLLNSGRGLIGDVKVSWPNTGFPYYEELIEDLEADPMVTAAAPVIETFGLISLADDRVLGVTIRGIEGESFARVTTYDESIWWRPIDEPLPRDDARSDPRLGNQGYFASTDWAEIERNGLTLSERDGRGAAVPGIHVSDWNIRTPAGTYQPAPPLRVTPEGEEELLNIWLPDDALTMHVMPIDSSGRGVRVVTRTIPVANEFKTDIFEIDSRTVLARLDVLQEMLNMQAEGAQTIEEGSGGFEIDEDGELVRVPATVVATAPARVTDVIVRGEIGPGETETVALKERVRAIYEAFAARHRGEVPPAGAVRVLSWRDLNRTQIAAVQNETGLVLFIFGLVCFTTVFLVLAIFWSMISEKTRDIGVLRALGASTAGVTWLWLRYGALLGAVGGLLGLAVAWMIVSNINAIHDWMGVNLGLKIWDPSVYYFVEIPEDLDATKAIVVVVAGVSTCLLGAAIPALRAGLLDPVRALRFE